MEKQAKADQPFFLWYNAMHFRTHVAEENLGKSGQDEYSDRMVVHDEQIGQILDKLDELGIADNTFVMYSIDMAPRTTPGRMAPTHPSVARKTPSIPGRQSVVGDINCKRDYPEITRNLYKNPHKQTWESLFRLAAETRKWTTLLHDSSRISLPGLMGHFIFGFFFNLAWPSSSRFVTG